MKKNHRTLMLIGVLLALTCWTMAYSGNSDKNSLTNPGPLDAVPAKTGVVSLSGHLVQDKIHMGGDGTFTLALTLAADEIPIPAADGGQGVDMVVVLDRSGSMSEAGKLSNATGATLELLSKLSEADRFALVSYSDQAQRHGGLLSMNSSTKTTLEGIVRGIQPRGGTNLGAGLQEGIQVLTAEMKTGRISRLILISDGLANQGITDPMVLGNIAAMASDKGLAVSSIGVGLDFNEHLLSAIADRGAGNYYFMENAAAFAQVFDKEYRTTRTVAAESLEIRTPLLPGMALVHASGYPIEVRDGCALFRPGDLLAGKSRKLFLTFRVPTNEEKIWDIGEVSVHYRSGGRPHGTSLPGPLRVACVANAGEAMASISKAAWEEKVIKEDFNRLREEVAAAVGEGKRDVAMKQIDEYASRQQTANATVGSEAVAGNLEKDVQGLRQSVTDSFIGTPAQQAYKQKVNAKSMQFEGYQGRRSKN